MVEKSLQKNTNIDNKPLLAPQSTFCWDKNKTGTSTALLHHYSVETESFYLTNSYTVWRKQNQHQVPLPPPNPWMWNGEAGAGGRGEDCSATLVIRLYCAPLIGICRVRDERAVLVSVHILPLWAPFYYRLLRLQLILTYLAPLDSVSPSIRQKSWLYALKREDILVLDCPLGQNCFTTEHYYYLANCNHVLLHTARVYLKILSLKKET